MDHFLSLFAELHGRGEPQGFWSHWGRARSFRSLKTSQRCLQHLGAFVMSMCFGGKVLCRWERANLKPQRGCFLGGWTSKLLSQVYDLPQRPGWVPTWTERSLSSKCCLVYAVSSKSPKEMQNNNLIKSILDPFFSQCNQWRKQWNIGLTVL